jgi:hypothetical protein
MGATSSYNSNAYTEREKKFLLGPLTMITLAASVFLYIYTTIPSQKYALHEEAHHSEPAAGHGAAGHGAGEHAAPKH